MIGTVAVASANSQVDFGGSWKTFWDNFSKGTGIDGFMNLLAVIGVILLVLAIIAWAFDRRKAGGFQGSGRSSGGIMAAALIGGIFVAPDILIPIFLGLVDLIVNALINVVKGAGKVG